MTTREKLHRLVAELNEAGVEAALVRLARERNAVQEWAKTRQRNGGRRRLVCGERARGDIYCEKPWASKSSLK